jgi:hypothetical protein
LPSSPSDAPFPEPAALASEGAADALSPERRLAEAQKRLRLALDGLDHALSRHNERALEQSDQAAEFDAVQEDRSRLAQECEAALARMRALEAANIEASRRIERASAAVRAVIGADGAREN